MSEIATLKGMKCPQCGSDELVIKGKPGGAGKGVAGALLGGAAVNLIASGNAANDEDGIPVSIDGIPIAPDAGSKNYEGIGDTSIYDPIESFGVEFPSIP